MTLTEFLLARIAEDEAAAGHADWAMQGEWFTTADDKVDEYVRRLSPARVLAECQSKRRIVENWRLYSEAQFPDYEGGYSSAMDDVLKLLALPYADHPDYREEWKP